MAFPSSNTSLHGWHPGELQVQRKLGFEEASKDLWSHISNYLPDQHRRFHASKLHFLPIATEDPDTGRVWSTMLVPAPEDAASSHLHIESPSPQELVIRARLCAGDPAVANLRHGGAQIAGVGIEMSTRRRNKFAGHVSRFATDPAERSMTIHVDITEAIGNCPKYINVREFAPVPVLAPAADTIAQSCFDLGPSDPMPASFVDFIHRSDTIFMATAFHPAASDSIHPAHLGSNHRGGMPGFCRVLSKPGTRSVVHIPDYSGNRMMTSLGNIASTPRAGVAFPDFETGDCLYITGEAALLFGDEAEAVMPRIRCLTTIAVTDAVLVKAALPFRADPSHSAEPSPYTPPVRYLAEEPHSASVKLLGASGVKLGLIGTELLLAEGESVEQATLARFDFEAEKPLEWRPGQYAILDLTELVGKVPYQHMTWDGEERAVNDDGIRSWTISSVSGGSVSNAFSLTMREIPNGRITPMLFRLARALELKQMAARPLGIHLGLRGIGGEFTLDGHASKLLFVAGGIGITPSLAFLRSLNDAGARKDVELWLGCKGKEVSTFVRLVQDALGTGTLFFDFRLRLFVTSPSTASGKEPSFEQIVYDGRLARAAIASHANALRKAVDGRLAYLCGPPSFEDSAVDALESLGVRPGDVRRESFAF